MNRPVMNAVISFGQIIFCAAGIDAQINFQFAPEQFREAAARFVVRDVRPFVAIEGEGLLDFM